MKFNLNKVCDLSSISVLPPHSRKTLNSGTQVDSSTSRRSSQAAATSLQMQLQSSSQPGLPMSQQQQLSQFSQGLTMSQLSQNSDDFPPNEQRIMSQERDLSLRKISSVQPISYAREDSQIPMSRSSTNVARRWNKTPGPDEKCQVSEEVERRIGLMETSISRLGMILDSVQSDVMQVNRSVKEVLLGNEGLQQKMVLQDKTLLQTVKVQEDIKSRIESDLKCILDKLQKDAMESKLGEFVSLILALPNQIQAQILNVQNDLLSTVTTEVAKLNSIKSHEETHLSPTIEPPNNNARVAVQSTTNKKLALAKAQHVNLKSSPGSLHHSKARLISFPDRSPKCEIKNEQSDTPEKCPPSTRYLNPPSVYTRRPVLSLPFTVCEKHSNQETIWKVIESDEEMDRGFSFLLKEKETSIDKNRVAADVNAETRRILRKARRRKRKYGNPIIIL